MDRAPVCAYCRKHPVQHEWRPFCSERCKLLDLARWVNGEYRIAGDPTPPDPGRSDPPER